ncbi:nucleoside phosphorylase domain-containing protein [Diplogelasinospora grovesii]|uniref:Nucleoside phosphorylase domain-containing protein n=1 Tax=Diplogelasinospora grovesii TaxID=303347 RepID=A0AAN6S6B7_9PEZI|nr:nucleoside phosphorylase domain-containing protein [Diplogelasinospora grovesii]
MRSIQQDPASYRPVTSRDFEIAVICALPLEADADDDGPPYNKALSDPNAYFTSTVGGHNVILAHMPGIGKANAAAVAANIRLSFPNIKLAVIVSVCGCVPLTLDGDEIVLGDVIINMLLDSLRRPNAEIRGYLSAVHDKLFNAAYRYITDRKLCDECSCNGSLISRTRLSVISFEIKGVSVWDSFLYVVIKGTCDYADSYKIKAWQQYIATMAVVYIKVFLKL